MPFTGAAMPFRRTGRRVLDPVVEFLRIEVVGGAVLLAATIAALALANSAAHTVALIWHGERDRNDPVAMARLRSSGCRMPRPSTAQRMDT